MKYYQKFFTFIILLFCISLVSCTEDTDKNQPLRIAISKEGKSRNYSEWLKRQDTSIIWFNMYNFGIDSALKLMENCDGLLLTGGADVFPGNYGQIEDTARCGSFDLYRDSLEFALIKSALKTQMPIIGVCRGLQILNISLGGSLYIDIPTDYDTTTIHRQKDWRNCYHPVYLVKESLLHETSSVSDGDVTSNHHQGIKKLGDGLRISSYSNDSLPESIEYDEPGKKGFLLAVQWHPERMDSIHPLSAPIAKLFLDKAKAYKLN